MVEAGLSNKSMSKTETFGEVSLSAYSRTICQVAPAGGCQIEPAVWLAFVGRGGAGVLEAEPPVFDPEPCVRPTPRPTPNAIAMTKRIAERSIQNLFEW